MAKDTISTVTCPSLSKEDKNIDNTIKQIDFGVETILEGNICLVEDYNTTDNTRKGAVQLFQKIVMKMTNEHSAIKLKLDRRTLTISKIESK